MAKHHPTPAPACRQCSTPVHWLVSKRRYAFFCSAECRSAWRRERWAGNKLRVGLPPSNRGQTGQVPWNKGLLGTHFSPATEFKPGRSGGADPVGTVRVRTDQGGHPRAWVKVAMPNRWLQRASVVWERHHGAIPRGCVVHHRDRDTLNDDVSNLQALTRAQHLAEHRQEMK